MTNAMSPEDHLRARIESQRQEIEQLRGEAEVADEQLAQLRGFAEAHKTCRGSDEPCEQRDALQARAMADAQCAGEKVFTEWNDVTGYFNRGESYYGEIISIIEDAVEIGFRAGAEGASRDASSAHRVPSAVVVSSVCGKPMPDGKGAGQCINPPGHEGDCDDMPF